MNKSELVKILNRETEQIKKTLTPEDIFTSTSFHEHINNLVQTLVAGRRDDVQLHLFYDVTSDTAAMIQGSTITANMGCPLVRYYSDYTNKYLSALGLVFHQVAHLLYLDFDFHRTVIANLREGQLTGDLPEIAAADTELAAQQRLALEEMQAALGEKAYREIFVYIYTNILRCIYDPHNEDRLIQDYGEFVETSLTLVREVLKSNAVIFEDLQDFKDLSELQKQFSLILYYARFRDVYRKEEHLIETNRSYQRFMQIAPAIDAARDTEDNALRIRKVNEIVLYLWRFVKAEIAYFQGSPDSAYHPSSNASHSIGLSGGQSDLSEDAESNGKGGRAAKSATATNAAANSAQAGTAASGEGDAAGAQEGGSAPPQSAGNGESSAEEQSGNADSGSMDDEGDEDEDDNGASEDSAEELGTSDSMSAEEIAGKIMEQLENSASSSEDESIFDGLEEGSGAGDQSTDTTTSEGESAAVNNLMNKIAKDIAQKNMEDALSSETNAKIKTISQNSHHQHIEVIPKVFYDYDDKDVQVYNAIMKNLLPYSKRLKRHFLEAFRESRDDGILHKRNFGDKFEARNAYRPDQRFYAKRKIPNDVPDMAISLLIDHSGSMSGARLSAAMATAMLLHDFATGLSIPVAIAGHNVAVENQSINYISYTNFDKIGDSEKYKLAKMRANSCNRDGAAIEIAANMLAKRPEDVKILIIISDGQPNDTDYGGFAAAEDIKSICKKYKRKRIQIVTAAIGEDRENIREIYGLDTYLDISDIDALPKKIVNLIARKIRF